MEPQEFWHIIPPTEKTWRWTGEEGAAAEGAASKPTMSRAATRSATEAAAASCSTVAEWVAKEAAAKSTPGVPRSAFATVEPHEFWHIMPETERVVQGARWLLRFATVC